MLLAHSIINIVLNTINNLFLFHSKLFLMLLFVDPPGLEPGLKVYETSILTFEL